MAFVNFKPMLHTTFFSVLWMFFTSVKGSFYRHYSWHCCHLSVWNEAALWTVPSSPPSLLCLTTLMFAVCNMRLSEKHLGLQLAIAFSCNFHGIVLQRQFQFVITKDKVKNQILTVTRLKSEKRRPQFERNTTVVNKYPRSVTIRQAWCTRSKRVCNAAIRAETTETPFTPLQSTWLWSCYFKVLKKRYVMLL